jgi:hypothetical protein
VRSLLNFGQEEGDVQGCGDTTYVILIIKEGGVRVSPPCSSPGSTSMEDSSSLLKSYALFSSIKGIEPHGSKIMTNLYYVD